MPKCFFQRVIEKFASSFVHVMQCVLEVWPGPPLYRIMKPRRGHDQGATANYDGPLLAPARRLDRAAGRCVCRHTCPLPSVPMPFPAGQRFLSAWLLYLTIPLVPRRVPEVAGLEGGAETTRRLFIRFWADRFHDPCHYYYVRRLTGVEDHHPRNSRLCNSFLQIGKMYRKYENILQRVN